MIRKCLSLLFAALTLFSVLPVALFQSILFFFVGGLFDVSVFGIRLIPAILLCLVTSMFFISVGIFFGCIFSEKSIGGISSIIIAGQSVLSGMWFPTDGLGSGILAFMNVLPFRNATVLIQNTAGGINDFRSDFLYPLIVVLSYTALAAFAAILAFKAKMREK